MKHTRRLATRAFRAETGEFLAEGPQAVREALAEPGATVEVWFHRRNVPGYTKRRTLTADAAGRWTTSYVAVDDHRYYAVAYGLQSASVLTQIPH